MIPFLIFLSVIAFAVWREIRRRARQTYMKELRQNGTFQRVTRHHFVASQYSGLNKEDRDV